MYKALATLGFALVSSVSASAAWDYAEYPSAFRTEVDQLIGTRNARASVILRCRDSVVRWYFKRAGVSPDIKARLQAGRLAGVFRVDERVPVQTPAIFSMKADELSVEFPGEMRQIRDLETATRFLSVAVSLNDRIVFEAHFDTVGIGAAAQKMLDNCR